MASTFKDLNGTELKMRFSRLGDRSLIETKGEIDLLTRDGFRSMLFEHVENGNHRIIVDLDGLDFMDSTGVAVLIELYKKILEKENGDLEIICSKDNFLKIFRITGLDKVFEIHETL